MLKKVKMDHTKLDQADLDYPRQELSSGGLKFVVVLTFFSGINFLCVYTGGPIQL